MAATSVTGTGLGDADKPSVGDLAVLAQGPCVVFSGIVEVIDGAIPSPGHPGNTVRLPIPLPGGADNYIVILTPIGENDVYFYGFGENDGDVTSFVVVGIDEGEVMFSVIRKGFRPSI